MALHRLHVVSFDRGPNENRVISKENDANCEEFNKCESNKNSKPSHSTKQSLQKSHSQKLDVKEVNKTEIKIKKQSNENQIKDAAPKILPSVRTFSLDDIGKRLKKCDSNQLKQNFKSRLKTIRTKHNITKYKDRKESQDDIKVLYRSQRVDKQNIKKSTDKNNRISRPITDNKSMNGLFSTQSVSKLRNNVNLYYQTYRSAKCFKTRTRKNRGSKSYFHLFRSSDPLCASNGKRDEICQKHYNLVDFSKDLKFDHATQKNELECIQRPPFLEQQAIVSPAILTVPVDKGDDLKNKFSKAVITEQLNTCNFKPITSTLCATQKSKVVKEDKKCGCRFKIPEEENYVMTTFFKILKSILKYILLGVTVVAWLPCIIVVFVCWFLVSPLTPDDVKADEMVPACRTCRRSFFSRLVECITRMYIRVKCCFEAVRRSLEVDDEVTPSPRRYTSTGTQKRPNIGIDSQPNPDRKYVLYHSQERGWLMKPMQGLSKLQQSKPKAEISSKNAPKQCSSKKKVSFWDSKLSLGNKKCYDVETKTKQTISSQPKRCYSCSCVHKAPTPPKSDAACNCCPVSKSMTKVRCPYDKSKIQSLYPPVLVRQPCPRRVYGACPHHKPVAHRRPPEKITKISQAPPLRHEHAPPKVICRPRQNMRQRPRPRQLSSPCPKKKKRKKMTKFRKQLMRVKAYLKCIYCAIEQSDRSWGQGIQCGNLYLSTLTKKPCLWVHNFCPKMYPILLTTSKLCENCCMACLFICSACVWCPIFLCCYLCYMTICDIMCCC